MKNKKQLFAIVLALMMLVLSIVVVACKGGEEYVDTTDYALYEGIYYLDVDGKEFLNVTVTGNRFSLTVAGNQRTGKYTVADAKLYLAFDASADATAVSSATATIKDGKFVLNYDGTTYNMVTHKNYTVTFVDGTTELFTRTVDAERALNRPTAPAKDNYKFITWYTGADFTKAYDFSNPVLSDMTLYARFDEISGQQEYNITFVDGDKKIEPLTTNFGKLNPADITKPDDDNFLGWWISDYQDEAKLTVKYDKDYVFEANTTLFAVYKSEYPAVSVTGTAITWDFDGSAVIDVTYPNGTTNRVAEAAANRLHTWSLLDNDDPAGLYKVSVTEKATGKTTTAYYNNKAVARVSVFKVIEPSVLVFEPVAGAARYEVTVICGEDEHIHKNVNTGAYTSYDFSNCTMQKGGIKFVVTAIAENGKANSVSEEFVYSRDLGNLEDLKVATNTDIVSWKKVDGASYYILKIEIGTGDDAVTYELNVGNTNKYALKQYTGNMKITVIPCAEGYNSPEVDSISYNKTRIVTPQNIKVVTALEEGVAVATISWDAVENANGYRVSINGATPKETGENFLKLTEADLTVGVNDYEIVVEAVGDGNTSSFPSDPVEVKYNKMDTTSITYKNGVVSWTPVIGAASYTVSLNGTVVGEVQDGSCSLAITLTGTKNVITIGYTDINGEVSKTQATMTVDAYSIYFYPAGGSVESNLNGIVCYVALGDEVPTPSADRNGYEFGGWYNVIGGPKANGKLYADEVYMDIGDTALYAYWQPKTYRVTYSVDIEAGTINEPGKDVTFMDNFELGVPKSNTGIRVFGGWYTEPNGQGTQWTDSEGKSVEAWTLTRDITLYPHWVDVFLFKLNAEKTGYIVEKGPAIGQVSSVTIPNEYEGKPIVYLMNFSSTTTLVNIRIPDTIATVDADTFTGCSNLVNIEVYKAYPDKQYTAKYGSYEGALYSTRQEADPADPDLMIDVLDELFYLPRGMEGTYTIPDGVSSIREKALYYAKLTKLVLPYTLGMIRSQAFYLSDLEELEFLDTPTGKQEVTLTISASAFQSCTELVNLTLPARLGDIPSTAFTSCTYLESITITGTSINQKYSSKEGLLCNAIGDTVLFAPKGLAGEIRTPLGVTTIGGTIINEATGEETMAGAFRSNTKITKVIISDQVTLIGYDAFRLCSGITAVEFESEATDAPLTIKERAFASCTNAAFTTIRLPANLMVLEKNAFASCTNLHEVYVDCELEGDKVNYAVAAFGTISTTKSTYYVWTLHLGPKAPVLDIPGVFGALVLKEVNVDPDNPNFYSDSEGVLFNEKQTRIILYPQAKEGEYTVPSTVTEIGGGVFYGKTKLTGITIGYNVASVGENAFVSCTGLRSVIFEATPSTETPVPLRIEKSAFESCTQLTEIQLPERLVYIGEMAFRYLSNANFTSIVIPDTVTEIGDYAFANCTYLSSVKLSKNLEKMGAYDANGKMTEFNVFYKASTAQGVSTMTLDDECENFKVIDNVLYATKLIGAERIATDLLFVPSRYSGKVTVPNTVTKVWLRSFSYCTLVTEVEFLNSDDASREVEFEDYTFYYCNTMTKLTFPVGMTSLPYYMCYYNQQLKSITIPYTVSFVEKYAFYNCPALTEVIFEDTPAELTPIELRFDVFTSTTGWLYSSNAVKEVRLPERMKEMSVYMFYSRPQLEKVYLPSSLEEISDRAFYGCTGLKEVQFAPGSALKTIGTYAFYNCKALRNFEIPASVTFIDTNAFYHNDMMESVTIPAGLDEIPNYAFKYCINLVEVNFAKNSEGESALTAIGDYAFEYCAALPTVTIPNSVVTIGTYVFRNCTSMTQINFEEGSQLASIGTYAFGYTAITKFAFPVSKSGNTLKTIKVDASPFYGCKQLTELYLSESIASLTGLFNGCEIKKITVSAESRNFSIDDAIGLILNKDGTAIHRVIVPLSGEVTIPDGIETIGPEALRGQTDVIKINIPESVTNIGNYAFAECTNLTSVNFASDAPEDAIKFGTYVFSNCTSLTTINLPSNTTTLGNYMFQYCTALKGITLPASLKTLGTYTFQYSGLLSISLPSKVTEIGNYVFHGCGNLTDVTMSGVTKLGNDVFSDSGIESFVMPATVKTIGTYVFDGCLKLKSMVLSAAPTSKTIPAYFLRDCVALESFDFPAGITNIGNYAFYGTGLKNIVLPSTLEANGLGTYVFYDSALESITIPTVLTTIPGRTFYGCSYLTEVVFPAGSKITTIDDYAFYNCVSLKSIDLPATVDTLNSYAFSGAGLESIKIPDEVVNIGTLTSTDGYAFANCLNLKSIEFGKKNSAIGYYAFRGCNALETITIPSQIETLGYYAFAYCLGLTEVTIDSDVEGQGSTATSLSCYSFAYSTSITKVVCTDKVTQIPGYMFYHCDLLEDLTLPDTLTQIGAYAFAYSGLTSIELPSDLVTLGGYTSTTSSSITGYSFAYCPNLESLVFNDKCTTIGTGPIRSCPKITSVELPDGITELPAYMFAGTGVEEVVIPETVTSMGTITSCNAFDQCPNLRKVTLPDALTAIEYYAFNGCPLLEEVNMPSKLEAIGYYAFGSCSSLKSISLPATLNRITGSSYTSYAFYNCTSLESVTFAPGTKDLKTIGTYAFGGTAALKSIEIPEGVEVIDDNAFNGSGVQTVKFPSTLKETGTQSFLNADITGQLYISANLTNIGYNSFAGNYGIEELVVDPNNKVYTVSSYGFLMTKANVTDSGGKILVNANSIVYAPPMVSGKVVIEEGVSIYNCAFNGSAVTEVVLPESITEIPYQAFFGANRLETINLSHVEIINSGAFRYCRRLKAIDLSSCTKLGQYAFESCESLVDVKLGEDIVLAAGDTYIFQNCKSLVEIEVPDKWTGFTNYMFTNCSSLKKINFPKDMTYFSSIYTFANCGFETLTFPEQFTRLAGSTDTTSTYFFAGNHELREIKVEGKITSIGYGAFGSSSATYYGCENLKSLDFLEGQDELTYIGAYAFAYSGIEGTLVLPKTVETYGTYVFRNSERLEEVVYTNAEATYGDYMFQYCTNLKKATFAEGIETINLSRYPFQYSAISEIVVPESMTTLPNYIFAYTTAESIVVPEGIKAFGTYGFYYAEELKSVVLPSTLEVMGTYMFAYCSSLQSVNIPDSVISIGTYAFRDCLSLSKIIIPTSVQTISASCFYNWTANQTIYCRDTVSRWGSSWLGTTCEANVVWGYKGN